MFRNIIKKFPSFSYSKFIVENKKRNIKLTKIERQKAIKRFLDETRK